MPALIGDDARRRAATVNSRPIGIVRRLSVKAYRPIGVVRLAQRSLLATCRYTYVRGAKSALILFRYYHPRARGKLV